MRLYSASSNFTRPANNSVYGSSDLIANSTTAGSVVPLSWTLPISGFLLTNAKLVISASINDSPQMVLYLFQFLPSVTNGDGGTFKTTTESGYLGQVYFDGGLISANTLFGSNIVAFSTLDPNSIPIFTDTTPGNSNMIYGLLATTPLNGWGNGTTSPPSAGQFTITLYGTD